MSSHTQEIECVPFLTAVALAVESLGQRILDFINTRACNHPEGPIVE
jgi:hypothetical protein